MRRAGSVEVRSMTSVAEGLSYESPRGTVEVRAGTYSSGCSWPQTTA